VAWHRLEITGYENTMIVGGDPKYFRIANAFQPRDIRVRAGDSRRQFHDGGSRPRENGSISIVDSVRSTRVFQSPSDLFGERVGCGEFVFNRRMKKGARTAPYPVYFAINS
jgi:hypothetical protein